MGTSAPATYVIGLYTAPFARQSSCNSWQYVLKENLNWEWKDIGSLTWYVGVLLTCYQCILAYEKPKLSAGYGSATFTAPKNNYFPIPQVQIDLQKEGSTSTLTQNPGILIVIIYCN